MMVPVFKRERANAMYTVTNYWWGRILSNIILQLFYPLSTVLLLFWLLDIDTSFTNFLMFVLYTMLLNFGMCSQGFFASVFSDDKEAAQQINTFIILISMLTSGGLGNLDAFPVWIQWLTNLSPQRYACAGFFRVMARHIPEPYHQRVVD